MADIMRALASQMDREAVIVSAALLDTALEEAVRARFVHDDPEMFKGSQPFASMGSKIRIARALGILPGRSRSDLEGIHTIRNAFAHSPQSITLETGTISDRCRSLFLTSVSAFGEETAHLPYTQETFDREGESQVRLLDNFGMVILKAEISPPDTARSRFLNAAKLNWLLLFLDRAVTLNPRPLDPPTV